MEILFRLLKPLDDFLVWMAAPFGAHVKRPERRYALLLSVFAALVGLGLLPIPVVPLLAVSIGYVGSWAVNRAWVRNEQERSLIARKIKDGSPDYLPDLRGAALVASLFLLLVVFPVGFMQVQRHFGLFAVPEGTNLGAWFFFSIDSYGRAFLGLLENYDLKLHEIRQDSDWAAHLVTFQRATFGLLLVEAIHRLLSIREATREAVAAVGTDDDVARRLGKRAVRPLVRMLRSPDPNRSLAAAKLLGEMERREAVEPLLRVVRKSPLSALSLDYVIELLGRLRDRRAVGPLCRLLVEADGRAQAEDDADPIGPDHALLVAGSVKRQCAFSLGLLGDSGAVEPLVKALRDEDENVRQAAARSLGQIGDEEAVSHLLEARADPDPSVRLAALASLYRIGGGRATDILLQHIEADPDPEVCQFAVLALGELGDRDSVKPLTQAFNRWDARLRMTAAAALARLGHSQAAKYLGQALRNPELRAGAVWALGEVRDREAREELEYALADENVSVRVEAAEALGKLKDRQAFAALARALEDAEWVVRGVAAKALAELGDHRAVPLLRPLLEDSESRIAAMIALGNLDPVNWPLPLVLYDSKSNMMEWMR